MGFHDSSLVLELGIGDQPISPEPSLALSLSNETVKKKKRSVDGESRVSSRIGDEDDDGSDGRKKLRLSKAQASLLEERFSKHNNLNPMLKQELARELILTPRQVEVWFQNRRARAKLKQTEMSCEFLKELCTKLSEENQRLQKELKAVNSVTSPLCMQIPTTAVTICPSCQRISAAMIIS